MEENWAKLKVFWATLDFLSRQEHLCKARKNVQMPSKCGCGGPTQKRHALYVPIDLFICVDWNEPCFL
jgi:hypothetical protein